LRFVILKSLFEFSNLGFEVCEVVSFLLDENFEVGRLGKTWSWKRSEDLWLLEDGTLEHLVSVVELSWGSGSSLGSSNDLGNSDNLLSSDQLLVDSSNGDLSSVNLVNKLSDLFDDLDLLSVKYDSLLGQFSDNLIDEFDLGRLGWGNINLLWSNSNMSNLSDNLLDGVSDMDNLLHENDNLLVEDLDSLQVNWLLSWGLLNQYMEMVDLLMEDVNLVNQMNNLLDLLENNLLVSLVDNSLWSWMETGEIRSSIRVQSLLDESVWLIAGFSGIESGDLFAFSVDLISFRNKIFNLMLVFSGVTTGVDWLEERVLQIGNVVDNLSLLDDELSNDLDLVNKNMNLLFENINLLDIDSLFGNVNSLLNQGMEVNDSSLVDMNLSNKLLDDSSLLNDDLLNLGDLDGFLLRVDRNCSSLDDNNLMVNLSDGVSNLDDLLSQFLDNKGVLVDLLDKNNSLGWLSNNLSTDSSDSSSDDNSLGNKFLNSDCQFLNNLSEFNNLNLDWLWSQTHLVWSFKFVTVTDNR